MKSSRVVVPLAVQDRRLRIELLHMRASYERLQFVQSACALTRALRPDALVAQTRDHLEAMGLGWLRHGLRLTRRLPVLLSLASALLSGRRRRQIVLKSALVACLFWLVRRPDPKDDSSD